MLAVVSPDTLKIYAREGCVRWHEQISIITIAIIIIRLSHDTYFRMYTEILYVYFDCVNADGVTPNVAEIAVCTRIYDRIPVKFFRCKRSNWTYTAEPTVSTSDFREHTFFNIKLVVYLWQISLTEKNVWSSKKFIDTSR